MKVLFAGDTHGDLMHCFNLIDLAKKEDCDAIVVLGDFGYWEHTNWGIEFLDALNERLNSKKIDLFFIDGNHENHTMLRYMYVDGNDDPMPEVRNRIKYIPRGTRFTWDGVSFLALGGAYSIDVANRLEGSSWWPEEMITQSEIMKCGDEKVDVLLSHDAPAEVPIDRIFPSFHKNDSNTYSNRQMLQAVVDDVDPNWVLHGHYHYRYNHDVPSEKRKIVGLGANVGPFHDSYVVVDLSEFKGE